MSLVHSYDVEDTDFVRAIRIHGEWHAVGYATNEEYPLLPEIDSPEQCDECGSTVSEEESIAYDQAHGPRLPGDQWPLRLNEQGAYVCTRPSCGRVYRVHLHIVKDTVL